MRYLKTYENYSDNEAPLQEAETLLKVLEKNIKKWFTSGSLSKKVTFEDSDKSFTNDVANKTLYFRFTDDAFLYQIIVVVGIKDLFDNETQGDTQPSDDMQMQEESVQNEGVIEGAKIENINLHIKKYDLNGMSTDNIDGPLIDFWKGKINVKDFTEDFIIEKISQMEDEDLAATNTALNSEETQAGGLQELF